MSVMHQPTDWYQICPFCGGDGKDTEAPDWADVEIEPCRLCNGNGVLDAVDANMDIPPYVPCPDCGARLHVRQQSDRPYYCDECGKLWPA